MTNVVTAKILSSLGIILVSLSHADAISDKLYMESGTGTAIAFSQIDIWVIVV